MYVGSVYNASVWVMLQPTDGSSHVINMSLQTTLDGNTSYPSMTPYPGVTVPADGAWHQISVTGYTMSSGYDQGAATLYLQTVPSSGDDLVSSTSTTSSSLTFRRQRFKPTFPRSSRPYEDNFHIGAAIDTTDLSGPHAQLLTCHFDSITPGQ